MAPHIAKLQASLPREVADRRALVRQVPGLHGRTTDAICHLLVGIQGFLRYAQDIGAITETRRIELQRLTQDALLAAAKQQVAHQHGADPIDQFLELLPSAISRGAAHVAGPDGSAPAVEPRAWGWRVTGSELRPSGPCVGWVVGVDLYLDPHAAYAVAQQAANAMNEALSVSERMLWKRMEERGLLAREQGRDERKVRRTLGGVNRRVISLKAAILLSVETANPANPANDASDCVAIGGNEVSELAGSGSAADERPPLQTASATRQTVDQWLERQPIGGIGGNGGILEKEA